MSDDSNESNSDSPAGMVENIGEQVASGLEGAAEGMEGEEGNEDVAKGLETAGDVATAASQGAAMVEGAQDMTEALREGDGLEAASAAGEYAGGLAGATGAVFDGAADLVDNEGVSEALQTAASVSRGIGGAARAVRSVVSTAEDIVQSVMGQRVKYEVHFDGEEGNWKVTGFHLTEGLSEPYELVLEVETEDRDADPRALLGADAEALITRGDEHIRRTTGIVRRVIESHQRSHHVSAQLFVVPAMWALGESRGSVIFQQKTAVEVLDLVLAGALGVYERELDVSGLGDGYATREYCVQYQESDLDFCHRLMEEEGIGYCFDFDEDGPEKVILFDRNSDVAAVATADDQAIPFRSRVGVVTDSNEPIVELSPSRQLTLTHQVVRDYDWTQASTRVQKTEAGEDRRGRTREVYEHGHGQTVSLFDFQQGGRYQKNDAKTRALRRREALIRDADLSAGVSLAIGMTPGRRFALTDHPTPGMDGDYLVTKVIHAKAPPPGSEHHAEGEAYHNRFECIPLAAEWRPKRRTKKPAIYGIQTAVVTGGNNGEIVTDEYGRVRVLFHWDREGAEPTSCWLRVSQTWAGHDGAGYPGFVFIPRVGMEVVVSFVNGDPDRPLVTGSVYNGTNLPPESLPDDASRSMIRTRSLGGDGYNELSFEDAGGQEEVHLRAERNLRELVQHDHATHVLHDQSNRVGGIQEIHVEGDRRHVHVDHEEAYDVDENRALTVGGMHEVTVHGEQWVEVDQDEHYTVHSNRIVGIEGSLQETVGAGAERIVESGGLNTTVIGGTSHLSVGDHSLSVQGNHELSTTGTGTFLLDAGATIRTKGSYTCTANGTHLTAATGGIELRSAGEIKAISPSGMKSIATGAGLLQQLSQLAETANSKLGQYVFALSTYGMKVDISGVKIDSWGIKVDNGQVKKAGWIAKLETNGVSISRDGLHSIG